MQFNETKIARHKTAIRRPSYSLPIKCLLRDGLVREDTTTVFDYGCGHGQDIQLLRGTGIECDGWDPVFRPEVGKKSADVVNLGYVINVVENVDERSAVVRAAWLLCEKVLVVSAQVKFAASEEHSDYADGVLTSWGTFQKYYTQNELRSYLEAATGSDAIPAAPGVFYVFKDESTKQQFLATRYHRRIAVPRRRISELRFEENRDVLEPMMEALTRLGRLPGAEEFVESDEVIERFGSLKKAFTLIRRVTDDQPWDEIAERRTEDLLVYLALSHFKRRPKLSLLPPSIQRDIKAFLGNYRTACARADVLLFRAGDPAAIDQACLRAEIGKLVDNALIVHRSALDYLSPLLRIYEGCARALVGDIDEANLIKLHRASGKVSYIAYPDFDKKPHPSLKLRVKVSLPTLEIDFFDYSEWENPPVLSRKEEFLHSDHPSRQKFQRLTRQEEKHGLLDNGNQIDRQSHLALRLEEKGLALRGHRVVRR